MPGPGLLTWDPSIQDWLLTVGYVWVGRWLPSVLCKIIIHRSHRGLTLLDECGKVSKRGNENEGFWQLSISFLDSNDMGFRGRPSLNSIDGTLTPSTRQNFRYLKMINTRKLVLRPREARWHFAESHIVVSHMRDIAKNKEMLTFPLFSGHVSRTALTS